MTDRAIVMPGKRQTLRRRRWFGTRQQQQRQRGGWNGRRSRTEGGTGDAAWPSWLAPKSPAAAALEDSKLAKPGKRRRERERDGNGREGADMYSASGAIGQEVLVGLLKKVWQFDSLFIAAGFNSV